MKKLVLLPLLALFLSTNFSYAQTTETIDGVSPSDTSGAEQSIESEPASEVQISDTETPTDTENEEKEPKKKEFLSAEDKAKQEIADNNYSLSFFVQRMDLTLDQLDAAKKLSSEDKLKRESLLKSIYILRTQSRKLEETSLNNFKNLLSPEQLAVFEELRKEQLNYRSKYDVMAGNIEQQAEEEKRRIEFQEKLLNLEKEKEEKRKKNKNFRRILRK